ncbi:MAG TPA: sigma-E processing peptidase SpoIIGA [Clostridia bacterium]|nr:sigma-E processing peptidase SpoIIGA [Clostridia bacterium]
MEVYIEVVILNNLTIDFALILLTRYILRLESNKLQIVIAAIVGTAIAVVYPLVNNVLKIVINILLAPLVSAIFAKYKSLKTYIFATLIFAVLTFTLGGTALVILRFTGVDIASKWVTAFVLLSLGILAYTIRQLMMLKKSRQRKLNISNAVLALCGEQIKLGALYDSGNQLVDMNSGKPVVVLSRRVGDKFLEHSFRTITVKTVGGSVELPLLDADSLHVQVHKNDVDVKNFLVAIANENYNGFDLILHESFIDVIDGQGGTL